MKLVVLSPSSLPEELLAGLGHLCESEGFAVGEGGIAVTARRAGRFAFRLEENSLEVEYRVPAEFFRALSYLKQPSRQPLAWKQQPAFAEVGAMLDCSRNAVLTPDTVKLMLRKMALMGMSVAMMYTEDTYEIPQQPYFGYLRGRYTQQQLRELDRYAADLGIELIPCIQTLAHLERALHWPQNDPDLRDTEDCLMVGEEKVYAYIEQMFQAVRACFHTRRIHIGMDEAWSLGLGNFRFKNGIVPAWELMNRHLSRVAALAQKYNFAPMIWSDMYLRAASPTGGYYDVPDQLPQPVLDAALPDVPLVYWDYYHMDRASYRKLFDVHEQFGAPVLFAGGLWSWVGPVPAVEKMRSASLPGLEEARDHHISTVLATAWGDNGAECPLPAILYGLQLYAEFTYTGDTSPSALASRFESCVGEPCEAFSRLGEFDLPALFAPVSDDPVNFSKFLLYQDPLLPLFQADCEGLALSGRYESLQRLYHGFTSQEPRFEAMYRFYEQLAGLLALKVQWFLQAPAARCQSPQAAQMAALAHACARQCESCRAAWGRLWEAVNKPFGYEVIDLRMAGLTGRFRTAEVQMQRLHQGEIDEIETLACPKLRCLTNADGKFRGCYSWGECISACRI